MITDKFPIVKDDANETPIPSEWRGTLSDIVGALKDGDYKVNRKINGVCPVPDDIADIIAENLATYGGHLVGLPEEAWDTSVCQWMDDYWDLLIDLYTLEEGASDLVLSVRVYESGASYVFDIQLVYVP
ncbi:MAG: hypothetical protein Q8J78_12980 [Moraxellaceae bacterium]|nr:hypothetical protein [Moraxellaceae bacterium]